MTQMQKRVDSLSRPRRSTRDLADDLRLLADRWEALGDQLDVFIHFIPVKIVSVLECMLRDSIKNLVDKRPGYCQRAVANIQGVPLKELSDLLYKLTIGKTTMGDIVSIVHSCGSIDEFFAVISRITGEDFKRKIANASESWKDDDEMRPPIINHVDETVKIITEIFEFRHIIVHESPIIPKLIREGREIMLDKEKISEMFAHSILFAKALDWFLSNDLHGPRIREAAE